jgi:hypothetical protein
VCVRSPASLPTGSALDGGTLFWSLAYFSVITMMVLPALRRSLSR